jgi:signal transduction histidine kinase
MMPLRQRGRSPERAKTDDSLRTERKKTDHAMRGDRASSERSADGVVDRARAVADDVLTAARLKADHESVRPRRPAETGAVVDERARADSAVRAERASADIVLRGDRKDQAALLDALLVHERAATDAYLLTERARSDDAVAHRDDFLGMVAHDVRNLLNLVVLSLELLRPGDVEPPPHVAAAVTRIRRYTARMNRLIGDLVDVTSIDAGKLGGRIVVRVEAARRMLRFCVSDTGVGIPAPMLEAIFERFWQVGENDRRGLGLGLYISKCIVEAHRGRIWAESVPGKGSQLYFTLPVPSSQRRGSLAGGASRDERRPARRGKATGERRRRR